MGKTLLLAALLLSGSPAGLLAQPRSGTGDQDATETRERLQLILNQYPPSVRQVLRLDPSLLDKPDYMATYPKLAAFVADHPEVAHNPVFFIGGPGGAGYADTRTQVANNVENIFIGLEVMTGVIFGIGTLAWLIRAAIDHRRWIAATRIQTEAHTKIVERLTSNEDLLAYLQSPAGQRFLTAPAAAGTLEHTATPVSAPVSRILWSVQIGVVLAVSGAGLWLARSGVIEEVAQAMQVFAMLVMSVGIGFVLSAVAAYVLSRQLGLVGSHPDHA